MRLGKTAVPMMLLLLLCACGAAKTGAQTPIRLRTALTEAGGCEFTLELRADYGDYTRDFTLDCRGLEDGSAALTVVEPELARGITASVGGQDASVSFDDTVLAVEDFSSRRISPMAAPYLLLNAWREGYISASGMDGDLEQVRYLLGYGGNELEIVTWFQGETPLRAEISDGNSVLITCAVGDLRLTSGKVEQHEQEAAETDLGGD